MTDLLPHFLTKNTAQHCTICKKLPHYYCTFSHFRHVRYRTICHFLPHLDLAPDITVFRTCGVLDITVLPYYVSLYYTDISLKLTGKPLVSKSSRSL